MNFIRISQDNQFVINLNILYVGLHNGDQIYISIENNQSEFNCLFNSKFELIFFFVSFCSHFSSFSIIGDAIVRARGRGRGRGANYVPLSGGRKKIMSIRNQWRQKDVANAMEMKEELKKEKEQRQGGTK